MCVNAFHGYSHNYRCQLKHHPNVIKGIGIEDLETMERIFNATNRLASITRYMSPYRRLLFIDTYLQQWDDDKYANLGTFILHNYQQALAILDNGTRALEETMRSQGLTHAQLDACEKEEVEFFATLGKEPSYDVHAVAYVELLQQLRALNTIRNTTNARFRASIPANYTFVPPEAAPADQSWGEQLSRTRLLQTERRRANEKYDRLEYDVILMECKLGISQGQRWTPAMPQYISTLKYINEHKYHKALENLQRLVVQRLFELHKLNLSQTGKSSVIFMIVPTVI